MPEDSINGGPVISVRAFIEDNLGNILLLKRAETQTNAKGQWSLPGGRAGYDRLVNSLEKLVLQKTGLGLKDIDYLNYQDSPPAEGSELFSLNQYFKARGEGVPKIDDNFSEYRWVSPKELNKYDIAFGGNDAIKIYENSKRPQDKQLWDLVAEAESVCIPVNRELLIKLQAFPTMFTQLNEDFAVYRDVETNIRSKLERIQQKNRRGEESIITQIQTRTKEYASLFEKMIRKGTPDKEGVIIPRDPNSFHDNAGARAVVSFLKDVETVKHELLAISAMSGYKLIEEEDYINNPKDTGYRGLHLTLEIPTHGANFIPKCEIQIRTIGQHVWATTAHELTYKNKSIPPEYLEQFRTLGQKLYDTDVMLNDLRHNIEHNLSPETIQDTIHFA